jgi:hypothetical protein
MSTTSRRHVVSKTHVPTFKVKVLIFWEEFEDKHSCPTVTLSCIEGFQNNLAQMSTTSKRCVTTKAHVRLCVLFPLSQLLCSDCNFVMFWGILPYLEHKCLSHYNVVTRPRTRPLLQRSRSHLYFEDSRFHNKRL